MFDEQPDADPHGECAAEIHRLERVGRGLREALARCEAYLAPRVTGTGDFGEQTLLPAVREALRDLQV
jgi:hypothetical protein